MGEVVFKGPPFNLDMLRELLSLKNEGVEPFRCRWFWYDYDSCREDPQSRYDFFVVCDDKIVRENASFADYTDSGFDPSVLEGADESDSVWFNDSHWCEARTRFWYRKFYTETRTGQLMVLRPDEPILYHYERLQTGDTGREVQLVTLVKIYRLLLVALPLLLGVVFPSIRDYMAVVAAALGVNFLWLCWQTRKVGRQ
jgi:hypothetical protein